MGVGKVMSLIKGHTFGEPRRSQGLVARCVSLTISGRELLKGLSLSVRPGELTAILGPNGAGKSTLLKVLAGELMPNFGSITLNDRELRDMPLAEMATRRAVLPQETQLSFSFKTEEVVSMGRGPHRGVSHECNRKVVEEAMLLAEVDHLIGRNFTTLSGGERQRVQLARVLAQIWNATDDAPCYLLLDEPTSALDLSYQHRVLEIASTFAKERGMGVLAVLHDLNLASYYADRIAILKGGCLLCSGTPEEVLTPNRIEEVFGLQAVVMPHPGAEHCPLVVAPVSLQQPESKAMRG